NDGKGTFRYAPELLPDTKASGSCVIAADYDKDGDLDLFVGGRIVPGRYPYSPQSYLLKNTNGKFTDVSVQQLPAKGKMGMVCSALWTDYNNDGWIDLMVAGEFMPLTIIPNINGTMDFNATIRVKGSGGWWNSIAAADFDEDGDMDYLAGNLGLNSRFRASPEKPLCIYAKDFDKNGRIDPVMCYYIDDKNYIYPTRDEMVKQINSMRGRFETYKSYADVTFEKSFSAAELADALVLKLECTESVYLENLGNGNFASKALPVEAQFAPLYGMLTGDFNNDGHTDVLVAGNSYATESSTGRYDAMTGLLLTGNGKGNFQVHPSAETGLLADKDVKALAEITGANGKSWLLVANNNDRMECYSINTKTNHHIHANPDEEKAIIRLKNGISYRQEFYYGNNYLSQTSRKIAWSDSVQSVDFYNTHNEKRTVQ
ncbi:MAG TPA: VCBS repeat-containing protein, partial [Flavitalea sp.]|nr:VCBS repeat-containing protein [Flavitalea sp.]